MNSLITLTPGESLDIVMNGRTVRVKHITDSDGDHAVELRGVGCSLEGEMPGLYYPVPLATE